jgi:hypothetical protein
MSLGGTLDTVPVLRGFLKCAKAPDAFPAPAKELTDSLRGALDTAAVLRGFFDRHKVT